MPLAIMTYLPRTEPKARQRRNARPGKDHRNHRRDPLLPRAWHARASLGSVREASGSHQRRSDSGSAIEAEIEAASQHACSGGRRSVRSRSRLGIRYRRTQPSTNLLPNSPSTKFQPAVTEIPAVVEEVSLQPPAPVATRAAPPVTLRQRCTQPSHRARCVEPPRRSRRRASFRSSFPISSLPWARAFFPERSRMNPSLLSSMPTQHRTRTASSSLNLSLSATPHPRPSACPKPSSWASL